MDIYAAIEKRRSIRDFSSQEVDPVIVRRIIAAGMCAPSNNHLREWHFILLNDLTKRKALLDQTIKPVGEKGALGIINRWGLTDPDQRATYLDAIPKQYSMLMESPCLIIPCFRQYSPLLKPKSLSDLNSLASIWACVENILLCAAAEGLFGVTRIPFEKERKEMKTGLGLPEGYEIPCWIALGYPAENTFYARQVTYNLDERIHVDRWLPESES